MRRKIPFAALTSEAVTELGEGGRPVDWDAYLSEHLTELLSAFDNALSLVIKIIQATSRSIYATEAGLQLLTTFQKRHKKATPAQLRNAATRAGQIFMRMEWSIITRFEVMLVLNAINRRDERRFLMTRDLE